jgi:dTDP-4-dehydrorhamnose 3,5-epimerase
MRVVPTAIPDVKLVYPTRHGDARGFFSETWNRRTFEAAGVAADWVQDNHAFSVERGVLRGLHYQVAPAAQTKLVRVARGAVFDVAVDLRRASPTYGKHVAVTLSAEDWNQLLVPRGFAHGYCTLEPDTEVLYKVDALYSAAHERGIRWDDPDLAIAWPIAAAETRLSDKDLRLPGFAGLPPQFE